MQFVPLRVICRTPVRRLAGSDEGGAARSLSPRTWLWVVCPFVGGLVRPGRSGAGKAGGWSVCRPPSVPWLGGPRGRGQEVALPRSVRLPLLGRHQSGLHRRRSVHGGCGLHTAPVHVRALPPECGPRGALARPRRTVGLSRSLWERAGDALGACGVWARCCSSPGVASQGGGGGGGGGSSGPVGGNTGLTSP